MRPPYHDYKATSQPLEAGTVATSVWSQDLPTSFHFNCESGEASMDAHYDDTTWVVDGANLS